MGKQVPPQLLQEIRLAKMKEIEEDAYNNFNSRNVTQVSQENTIQTQQQNVTQVAHPQLYQNYVQNGHISKIPTQMAQQMKNPPPPPHKYSPQYAAYVGAKPRAQASARIRLGGAF